MVSSAVAGHHSRVGALAAQLGTTAGLDDQEVADLALAGMLHDVGAFALKDRLAALDFESTDSSHPETGYRLLRDYPAFHSAAGMIRAHHTPWVWLLAGFETPGVWQRLGNLLCMVDRLDTLLPRNPDQTPQPQAIAARIRAGRGRHFNPIWVDAFDALADDNAFWDSLCQPPAPCSSWGIASACNPELCTRDVSDMARLFSQIIDFRCRFTATHSRGVTAIALTLGEELGMPAEQLEMLGLAAQLHDLGKLGVPSEIILKPGALDNREMATMRQHPSHGFQALSGVPGLADVARWVGQHHERLNGRGYPRSLHADDIDIGSRVLAVADVFTALAEDRPYRKGMELERIAGIIRKYAREGELDGDVASPLLARQHELDALRREEQAHALHDFERFAAGIAP